MTIIRSVPFKINNSADFVYNNAALQEQVSPSDIAATRTYCIEKLKDGFQ